MKNFFSIIGRCLGLIIFFSVLIEPCAEAMNSVQLGKGVIVTQTTSTEDISDKILKKEEFSVSNYKYSGNLDKCGYKYPRARRDITYLNKVPEKILAMASTESNFRYNTETRQAECLSISREVITNDKGYTLSLFSRSVNKNTEVGSGISNIKFRYLGRLIDKDNCEISCDCMSNVECKNLSE